MYLNPPIAISGGNIASKKINKSIKTLFVYTYMFMHTYQKFLGLGAIRKFRKPIADHHFHKNVDVEF